MTDLSEHTEPTPDGAFAGRVALVTGGASGLGAATCRALGAGGATVIVADLRLDPASEVAQSIEASGGHAQALEVDVADARSAARAVEGVLGAHGHLDVLVNAAGVDVTLPAEEIGPEEWRRIMGVNLDGPFWMSRAALPAMREQGGGHVVNVASTAAKRAWANASAYHASKWGLLGLSHALHVEARAYGVKVTAVVSGGMRTPFLFDRFPDLDPEVLQPPEAVAHTILFVLQQPEGTVIPEVTVIPMRETSWP
ncbi:MAG: SDR family oxidoreductase [Dehalococcoidia bacterium]|nr:SDR family oxidoreductase [Dehalococcoidia bacterium]